MTGPRTSLRNAPSLVWQGLQLVRRSGLKLPITFAVLDLLTGALLAAELLLIRWVTGAFLDDTAELAVTGLVLFASTTALRRVASAAADQLKTVAAERVEWSLVNDVMSVAAAAPFEEFENPEFHDRLRRALNAAQEQVWTLVYSLLRLTNSGVAALSLILVMVAVAPALLLPFAVAGLVLVAGVVVQTRLRYRFEFLDTASDRERVYLREALISRSEGREARLFGSRKVLIDRHEELQGSRLQGLVAMVKKRLAIEVFGSLTLAVVLIGVFATIAVRARDGDLAVADAAVAALTAHQLIGRLQTITGSFGSLHESTLFLADLIRFTDVPRTVPPHHSLVLANPPRAITLRGVSYTYPDTGAPAVENINLRVEAGEIVALVGENGAGKSTVAKLFSGLYQPTSGDVLLEGEAVEVVDGPLTGVVSAVFQEFARYDLTVAENVWLGAPWLAADESSVHAALTKSGADSILGKLPDGLDSRLGRRFEAGLDLSLGQWQRLALARAFFSPAPFLILDEPTASLDPRIEAGLFDRLHDLCAGRGVLLISHRYSTLKAADRIVVIDDGRVAETGTHDELIAADGVYAALYNLQADRYQEKVVQS